MNINLPLHGKQRENQFDWLTTFLKIMKYSSLILLLVCMSSTMLLAFTVKGQNIKEVKINLNINNKTLDKVFEAIEQSSSFKFTYDPVKMRSYGAVSIVKSDISVEKALKGVLPASLIFEEKNAYITIKERSSENKIMPKTSSLKADIIITGKVTDANDGESLPGVAVTVKGTTIGTTTDLNGKFSITVNDKNRVLVFSFLGYQSTEKSITGEGNVNINVKLSSSAQGLDEVVVVGYGTQKKESVVAAISTISAKDIVRTPTANLLTGLAGKLPGLTIMVKDGELGKENVQTLIRGQATTNGSQPLILIDGVEREISTLDPYDIESISILKDASATAVFGVRGANGVILVTSKRGMVGKPTITATVNYSAQAPTRLPKPLNAIDYMTVRNEVIRQDNESRGLSTPIPYSDQVFDYYKTGYQPDYYVDRNFFDEFLKDYAPMAKTNFNIRGGNEKTKYFVSAGYLRQAGPFKTEKWSEYNYDNAEKLDRFNYRSNIDIQINKSLKAWLNLSGYLSDKNDPIVYGEVASAAQKGSYYYLLLANMADVPAISYPDLDPQGNIVSTPGADRTVYGYLNRTGYRITTNNNINSTLGLEQDLKFITKGLSARVIGSYDTRADHIRGFRRSYQTYNAQLNTSGPEPVVEYSPGIGTNTELIKVLTQSFTDNFDLEASLNYARKFNKHNVTGLLLYKKNQRVIDTQVPFNYVGIVGRTTYAYDNKYLAEFNFGYNGSEQFASGRRFGFFPSVSAGWVASEEPFLKSVQAIEFLKFRGSFGQVGNDRISDSRFIYLDDWRQGSGGWLTGLGGISGLPTTVYQNTSPNPLVSWEVANKYNIGFESRFLKGFELEVDLFYEKRNSILITTVPIPTFIFGQQNLPPRNDGVMTNRGFETTLGYSKSVNKDLFLGARVSAAFARNKMEHFNETPNDDSFAYPYRTEGYSRGTFWGYDNLGYFNSVEEINGWADETGLAATVLPGDLKYRDVNGDGVIDVKDLVPMKSPSVPELNVSLTLSAQYKAFDMNVLFYGVSNYGFNMLGRGMDDWAGVAYGGIKNYFEHHKDAWSEEKVANGESYWYPRMHPDGVSVSKQPNNFFIKDLTYIRLKNLEFGYTLPEKATKALGLGNVRAYFNGANLFLFDNLPVKFLDPEVANSLSHPIYATYNFGLNITF